jgi:DNA-binding NtrC family response regulator
MKNLNILVVDDNPYILKSLVQILACIAENSAITAIHDAPLAISAIENGTPANLVITDFRIPSGREGLEIIRAARIKSPSTAIIVMSGDMTETDIRDCMCQGANAFLQKPFLRQQLEQAIKAHVVTREVVAA